MDGEEWVERAMECVTERVRAGCANERRLMSVSVGERVRVAEDEAGPDLGR